MPDLKYPIFARGAVGRFNEGGTKRRDDGTLEVIFRELEHLIEAQYRGLSGHDLFY
jgi:hypothetical protein